MFRGSSGDDFKKARENYLHRDVNFANLEEFMRAAAHEEVASERDKMGISYAKKVHAPLGQDYLWLEEVGRRRELMAKLAMSYDAVMTRYDELMKEHYPYISRTPKP